MKTRLITLIITTTLISLPAFAETTSVDTPQTRKEAASRYLKAGTLQSEIDGMVNAMTQQFGLSTAPDLQTFVQTIQKSLDVAQMENVMEEKLIQYFTTDELNAMASFYGSDTGRAIDRKMPQFTAETLRAMMPMLQEAFIKATGEVQKAQQPPLASPPALPVQSSPLPY